MSWPTSACCAFAPALAGPRIWATSCGPLWSVPSTESGILHFRASSTYILHFPPRPAPHGWRGFRQLAQQPNSTPQSTAATKENSQPAQSTVAGITNAEQRRRDWAIVRRLAMHIWPKDDWGTRGRVILGVGLLVGGKVRHTSGLIYALLR
jgi:hypothetical protein